MQLAGRQINRLLGMRDVENHAFEIKDGLIQSFRKFLGDRGYSVIETPLLEETDLFVRKDFPQRLGVLLVVVGLIGSTIAWYFYNIWLTYGILFGTVLIDLVLYVVVSDCLMCYRCGAIYRGLKSLEEHKPFNLETHERYRQAAARMSETTEIGGGRS